MTKKEIFEASTRKRNRKMKVSRAKPDSKLALKLEQQSNLKLDQKPGEKPEGVTEKQWHEFQNAVGSSTIEWILVTPTQAEEWMKRNTKNRNLKPGYVSFYAEEIKTGNWMANGQTVIFGRDGVLIDGQHRLAAIIQADQPAPLLVVRGIVNDAFKSVDRGRSRVMADLLTMAGESNGATIACACRYLYSFQHNGRFGKSWGRVTFSRVEEILNQNPNLRVSASFAAAQAHVFSIGSPSLFCTMHYLLSEADDEHAAAFFDRLSTGADLSSGHPILQLRNLVLKNRTATVRYPVDMIGRFCIKAWNLWVTDDRKQALRVDDREELKVEKPKSKLSGRIR